MGWIGCVHCEKFRCDFAARTVQPVLYRASCSNETIQNASKHYETHQNMSFGPNGVDRVPSLQNILMRLCGTNFCTNCTSSTRFATSFVLNETIQNALKHYETHQTHEFSVKWGWIGCVRCEKFRCDFVAQTFALIAPVQPVLYRAACSNETIQNASKHYKTHQNMSLGPNGLDRVHSLQKILMRLRGTNFCTNCTSSTRFATSFVQ